MGIPINWPTELKLLEPIAIGPHLQLFPLTGVGGAAPCTTLDEAQAKGTVVIEEQQEGEAVAEIDVTVLGQDPLLILEGELLEGALQNRVVNITLLLGAGRHKVPVNCVESGRWRSKRQTRTWYADKSARRRAEREFEATGTTLDADIRRRKMRSGIRSMRRSGRAHADQSTTWASIDDKLAAAAVSAPDSDLLDLHTSRWTNVREHVETAAPAKDQVGVVVAVAGRVVALESFGDAGSWAKVWRKVVSGYVGEAMDRRGQSRPATVEQAVAFARKLADAPWQRTPSPVGRGEHETLDDELAGFVLRDGKTVRHAVAFAA